MFYVHSMNDILMINLTPPCEDVFILLPYSIYFYLCFFIIYAFLGWCIEVVYAVSKTGKFVNRGFLNGPVCPIYGFGVVLVITGLTSLKGNLFFLFIASVVLTSALEALTGFVLKKVFHKSWWDYSDQPYNLGGYICLQFSLIWGIACILVVYVVHPLIVTLISWTPQEFGMIVVILTLVLFAVDFVATVNTVVNFNRRLHHLDELAALIKELSNELGENLTEGTLELLESKKEFEENIEDKKDALYESIERRKASFSELSSKYDALLQKNYVYSRLFKAFPGLKCGLYEEELRKLKEIHGIKGK